MRDLGADWTLFEVGASEGVPFALPGDGITALQAAGVIPDPYWGRNEYGVRWICERDWVATRSFAHEGGPCDLVIEGLDCVAEVRVNGVLVLTAANAHRRWRVAVDLLPGENAMEITFRSSVRESAARQAGMPFYIPYQQVNGPIPFANMCCRASGGSRGCGPSLRGVGDGFGGWRQCDAGDAGGGAGVVVACGAGRAGSA